MHCWWDMLANDAPNLSIRQPPLQKCSLERNTDIGRFLWIGPSWVNHYALWSHAPGMRSGDDVGYSNPFHIG